MKVLVTGGAGFIGSHFVEFLLKNGHDIAVVDEFNDFYDPAIKRANIAGFRDSIELHEADIRDADAMLDRKSTRLNSSHTVSSYAVFCLKKKSKRGERDRTATSSISLIMRLKGAYRVS